MNNNLTGIDLYKYAKEQYYNGTPIMTDYEFDELEESLGLSNKAYVGTSKNEKYTVRHPYKMGSLSKIQIKEKSDKNGNKKIDWDSYYNEVLEYIERKDRKLIITPKFDGCSFEAVINNDSIIDTISSRGDGDFGVDLKRILIDKVKNNIIYSLSGNHYTLRGEVLIDKKIFEKKYSDFVNPRSFVSGILNRDYIDSQEYKEMINDLSIVIYDVRIKDNNSGIYIDHDWTEFVDELKDIPDFYVASTTIESSEDLKKIYFDFENYRKKCKFALDGIVIKPIDRINNTTLQRPTDCVAIKFLPMLQETEIIDIEWNSVKTAELMPVIIYNTIKMDGKKLNRARANNYGWLIENKVSVGTKVMISLAGDIIPFIFKVTDTSKFDQSKLCLPTDRKYEINGIHCNLILTQKEKDEKRFLNSCSAVKIPKLGPANAKEIIDWFNSNSKNETTDFFEEETKECPNNFLLLTSEEILASLNYGAIANFIVKGYEKFRNTATLQDYIIACCFDSCGSRTAECIANFLLTGEEDFKSMNKDAYEWCFDMYSEEMKYLCNILKFHGKTIDDFRNHYIEEKKENANSNKTYIIMTGEPNNWKSKSDFLHNHPEYENTGSWKKCQIVFTNSLSSNTGKMKKARELGKEIMLY